ncbi:hypothetical protein J6590_098535 [Homalodisca vitripennis]|nr:hypothetical protein J6590_098535 [Homalodisca vitripennis]
MSEEEGNYLNRIETLSEELAATQAQVGKERKKIVEIENIFEDHDNKQEQLISEYAKKIGDLEKQFLSSDSSTLIHKTDIAQLETPRKMNAETQTIGGELSPQSRPQHFSTILLEIAKMKVKQDQMETMIKNVTSQSHCHCAAGTQQSVLCEQSTQTETISSQDTTPKIVPGAMKLNTPVPNKVSSKQYDIFRTSKHPPVSAKRLKDNETYEEFLQTNMCDTYMDAANDFNSPLLPPLQTPTANFPSEHTLKKKQDARNPNSSPAFLESGIKSKTRKKEAYHTRYFFNKNVQLKPQAI